MKMRRSASGPQSGCSVAVLIGGKSSRMGWPKSMAAIQGEHVLERIVKVARTISLQVVLAGDGPVPEPLSGTALLTDAPGVEGPLGGVLSAFRRKPDERWIILACDLPLVTPDAVRWLLAQAGPDTIAVLPHLDDPNLKEPLFALYEPAAGVVLEEGARKGERSICRILVGEDVASPRVPGELRSAWMNVNTPEEWKAALASCREEAKR